MDPYYSHFDSELDWKFIEYELSVILYQHKHIKKLIDKRVEEEHSNSKQRARKRTHTKKLWRRSYFLI